MTSLPHSVFNRKISHPGLVDRHREPNEPSIIKEGMVSPSVWGQMGSTHRASAV